MSDTINYTQKTNLQLEEIKRVLPLFPTRKAAIQAGKKYGWNSAIRLCFRFEHCWVVGKKMMQPEETGGVYREHYRFPLLRWEKNENNVEFCPVLTLYVVK